MSQLENFLMELYTEVKQRNDFTHSINKIEVNKFSENHKYIQSLIPFSEISSIKFIAIFQEKSWLFRGNICANNTYILIIK